MRCYTGQDASLRHKMYSEIRDCLQNGQRVYMLVPEQYTLEAELEALEVLQLKGSFEFQVLSPARLFTRIFETAGRPEGTRIDERGRVTLLSALISELELTRYKNAQKKPGFAQRMAMEIARCKQSGLRPEDLRASARDLDTCALTDKLNDTATVWEAYEEALKGRFLDGEDERFRALDRIPQADFLRDACIWARGFELVSPALADILGALEGVARQVTLLICCSQGRDKECWLPVQDSLFRLEGRIGSSFVREALPDRREEGEIAHLAREMSAYPLTLCREVPRHISIAALKTPEEEACYAIGLIRETVRQNGWRYRDCAILCDHMPAYVDRLHRAAALYDVPIFAEEQRPAASHASAQYLLFALKLIARNYPGQEARLLLRTGCTGLTNEECDILSNYIYEYGIRGAMWKKPFVRGKKERIEEAEPLREKFIAPLLAAQERLKAAANVREMLAALWQLAEDAGLARQLSENAARLFSEGHMVEAAESAQIWNRIVGEFDQLNELLGERRMPLNELARLLEAGLCASQVSPLPQSNDAVCAASVSRVRSRPFRLMVMIGCVDAQTAADSGLFDTGERAWLEHSADVWFPPDGDGRLRLRALDHKNAISLARDQLVLTWPLGASGERSGFGYPVRWARRIFPQLRETAPESILRTLYSAPRAAGVLAAAAGHAASGSEKQLALSACAEAAPHCPPPVISAPQTHLDPLLARKLYGGPMSVHISRLESFAACPFQHFVKYGLKPGILRPFEYEMKDRGELIHQTMDLFFRQAPDQETPDMAMDRAESILRTLIQESAQAQRIQDDPLNIALTHSLIRRVRAAADAAVFQLQGSKFRVCSTETAFDANHPVAFARTRDASIPISGRIDRLDLCEEGRRLVRVIDYKSSRSHSLDLPRLYYRLQLQLPIYLRIAANLYEAEPAGAYYLPAVGLVPQTESSDPEEIALARRESLALSGITDSDPEVICASTPHPKQALGLTAKDGVVSKQTKKAMPADHIRAISTYALRQAGQITEQIRDGAAQVSPVRLGDESPCKYCEYAAVCQIDGPSKRLPPLSAADALEKILESQDLPEHL